VLPEAKRIRELIDMNTIFVQIASYRDIELIPTIKDAIEQAHFPELLSFGICWQYQTESELRYIDALKSIKNCRVTSVLASYSKGVGWARAEVQKMFESEKYALQIDSHMRFVKDWDILLINMLNLCPSEKPVLTAYPASYTPPRILNNNFVSGMIFDKFHKSGIITFKGSGEDLSKFHLPQPGSFIAGGFIFSSSSIINEVPVDPNIYFLGEEFLFSARTWTRGWDIYHPNKLLCWHYYNEKCTSRPLHWQDNDWTSLDCSSAQRFRKILGLESSSEDFGIYGLGCDRALSAYIKICNISVDKWISSCTATKRTGDSLYVILE
jgi:Glycosyltransferase (GlcNAc)